MAKSTGLSASPPIAAKAAAASSAVKGKSNSKTSKPTSSSRAPRTKSEGLLNKSKVDPPTNDSRLDNSRQRPPDRQNDSFLQSKEEFNSRNVTTESSTRLVDSLVNAYTGENSGIDSNDTQSFYKEASTCSFASEGGSDCPDASTVYKEKFQRLDEAGEHLAVAREKVERVLDRAVEARIKDEKPVPAHEEKRAEEEEQKLTKAEGRLHRARERLAEKQEFRRQKKLEYLAKRQDAEKTLLAKLGGSSSAELRDHLLETFRPVIATDDETLNDPNHLEESLEWHLENDSEAVRLAQESDSLSEDRSAQELAEQQEADEASQKTEKELFASAEDKSAKKKEEKKIRLEKRERKKRKELECRLDGGGFKETVRSASQSERRRLAERELEKLEKSTPTQVRLDLEARLNEQLSEVQIDETKSAHKEDDQRRRSVDTLMETKAQRAGKAGQELNPISEAIDDLDCDLVRTTHKTLEDMDVNSITSVLDLERTFGRDISEVRCDLESQITRGGKSVPKARKTLARLDKLVRRSQVLGEGDGWDALMRCITPTGPNLGRFLGIGDGYVGRPEGRGGPIIGDHPGVDFAAARRITRRMAQSGSKVDDNRKAEIMARLGYVG